MKKRRVVITGLGIITSLGKTIEQNWARVIAGQTAIARITSFDPADFRSQIAAEVEDFDPYKYLEGVILKKEIKKIDRLIQFGLYAASKATVDSGIALDKIKHSRVGVQAGVGFVGINILEKEIMGLNEKGPRHVSPFVIPAVLPNMVSGQISIAFGLKGFNLSVSSACASGSHAIGDGFRAIQRGEVDVVIGVGAEAPISRISVAAFGNMRALSARNDEPQKASRPFDKDRDGFVIAEGSGALILEELKHAQRRNARIYGELVGFARNSDAFNITNPTVEGPRDCIAAALKEAKIKPEMIGYINPHATSTPEGDLNEAQALKAIFGKYLSNIPVASTKSTTGHLLGAAGAVEAIYTVLAVYRNVVPPNINLEEVDPNCTFLNIPRQAMLKEINYAISNSFGFGGTNACLVFKKFHE